MNEFFLLFNYLSLTVKTISEEFIYGSGSTAEENSAGGGGVIY
jgi:hypothetical protein